MRSTIPALPLVTLLACSTAPSRFVDPTPDVPPDARGDAVADAPDVPLRSCEPGRWYCDGSLAYQCDARGAMTLSQTCVAGARCLGGRFACGACVPGTVRCNPGSENAPQRCLPDGTRWEDHLPCDVLSGEQCVDGVCQRPCPADAGNENSYLGCEYWATPTANSSLNYAFQYTVVVANPGAREATVRVTGGPLASVPERRVAAGAVARIDLPWIDALRGSSAACFPLPLGDCQAHSTLSRTSARAGAYRITSDVPVAVYQFNPLEYRVGTASAPTYSFTADASLLLPQRVLGDPRNQEYIVVTRPTWLPRAKGSKVPYGAFVTVVSGGPNSVGPDASPPVTVTLETR
ncbi:MAG TPA: hypothetical protein VFV33_22095, partial [Gemmatimonadaceae bacterium]|nr:hypothetical protein [Gemmatimonadaceae bacterium]